MIGFGAGTAPTSRREPVDKDRLLAGQDHCGCLTHDFVGDDTDGPHTDLAGAEAVVPPPCAGQHVVSTRSIVGFGDLHGMARQVAPKGRLGVVVGKGKSDAHGRVLEPPRVGHHDRHESPVAIDEAAKRLDGHPVVWPTPAAPIEVTPGDERLEAERTRRGSVLARTWPKSDK